MSFRRTHTRGNPNSKNLYSVEDPKSLIRKRKRKEWEGTSQIERSFSQTQEEFLSFQDFDLETNFEQFFLRYKSKSYLKQVEINPNGLQSYLLDSLWKNL